MAYYLPLYGGPQFDTVIERPCLVFNASVNGQVGKATSVGAGSVQAGISTVGGV